MANPPQSKPSGAPKPVSSDEIRRLLRGLNRCALGTLGAADGRPFVSLAALAADVAGAPLMLLSRLSEHCRNIEADPRVSLLLDGTEGYANPLAGPRASLLGRIEATADPDHRRRFLARHPSAKIYVDFTDFAMFRVRVERIRWVGGFGNASGFEGDAALRGDAVRQFALSEAGLIERLEAAHPGLADTLAKSGRKRRSGSAGWRIAALDPDGCDIGRKLAVVRFNFPQPLNDPAAVENALLTLAGIA
jgi:putative heme iron utilization protein